jgi:hypothetical protein
MVARQSSYCYILYLIDDFNMFCVPFNNFSLLWRRHHYRWKVAKFRPILWASCLWEKGNLYRNTSAVKRDLVFLVVSEWALHDTQGDESKHIHKDILYHRFIDSPLLLVHLTFGTIFDLIPCQILLFSKQSKTIYSDSVMANTKN